MEDSICLALILLAALLSYYAGWFTRRWWEENKYKFAIFAKKRKKK